MILIGTMEWASTKMKGLFRCPNCDSNQHFRLRSSRPFLTLYFIPVIPIGGMHEYVQCRNCKDSFEKSILAGTMLPEDALVGPPEKLASTEIDDEPAFEEDLLKVLALMMIEDGHVSENEISLARRLFENMTEKSLSREDLGKVCSQVKLHRLTTTNFLVTARTRREHQEQLLLVQAMFGVAGADGEITQKRLQSLLATQEILGLDEREFQSAINATEQWLT